MDKQWTAKDAEIWGRSLSPAMPPVFQAEIVNQQDDTVCIVVAADKLQCDLRRKIIAGAPQMLSLLSQIRADSQELYALAQEYRLADTEEIPVSIAMKHLRMLHHAVQERGLLFWP